MTPKEKAQELYDKFRVKVHDRDGTSAMNGFEAKQCALIAVDEIMNFMEKDDKESKTCYWANHPTLSYWDKVKQEIEKL
jgi:hypothetical protein